MQDDDSVSLLSLLGFVAMILGALLGWGLVELFWQQAFNQGFGGHSRPVRGWGYTLTAAACSISLAAVGLALVRFRDLPSGEGDDSVKKPPH